MDVPAGVTQEEGHTGFLSGMWEREAHILFYMVTYEGSTRSELLEVYWPCAGGLSTVNAIGTQLPDKLGIDPMAYGGLNR